MCEHGVELPIRLTAESHDHRRPSEPGTLQAGLDWHDMNINSLPPMSSQLFKNARGSEHMFGAEYGFMHCVTVPYTSTRDAHAFITNVVV